MSNNEISVRAYLVATFFAIAGMGLGAVFQFTFWMPNPFVSAVAIIVAALSGSLGMIALRPLAMAWVKRPPVAVHINSAKQLIEVLGEPDPDHPLAKGVQKMVDVESDFDQPMGNPHQRTNHKLQGR